MILTLIALQNLNYLFYLLLSNIEKTAAQVNQMKPDYGTIALGSTGLIGLDPGDDKTQLYKDLVGTYNWHEKVNKSCAWVI